MGSQNLSNVKFPLRENDIVGKGKAIVINNNPNHLYALNPHLFFVVLLNLFFCTIFKLFSYVYE